MAFPRHGVLRASCGKVCLLLPRAEACGQRLPNLKRRSSRVEGRRRKGVRNAGANGLLAILEKPRLNGRMEVRAMFTIGCSILFAGFLCLSSGCATRPAPEASYSKPIVISFRGVQTITNDCYFGKFEIRNLGDLDMWFASDGGCERPYCIRQEQTSWGWDGPIGEEILCGNGLTGCKISPGTSTMVLYRFWPKRQGKGSFRIGIIFTPDGASAERTPHVVYWE